MKMGLAPFCARSAKRYLRKRRSRSTFPTAPPYPSSAGSSPGNRSLRTHRPQLQCPRVGLAQQQAPPHFLQMRKLVRSEWHYRLPPRCQPQQPLAPQARPRLHQRRHPRRHRRLRRQCGLLSPRMRVGRSRAPRHSLRGMLTLRVPDKLRPNREIKFKHEGVQYSANVPASLKTGDTHRVQRAAQVVRRDDAAPKPTAAAAPCPPRPPAPPSAASTPAGWRPPAMPQPLRRRRPRHPRRRCRTRWRPRCDGAVVRAAAASPQQRRSRRLGRGGPRPPLSQPLPRCNPGRRRAGPSSDGHATSDAKPASVAPARRPPQAPHSVPPPRAATGATPSAAAARPGRALGQNVLIRNLGARKGSAPSAPSCRSTQTTRAAAYIVQLPRRPSAGATGVVARAPTASPVVGLRRSRSRRCHHSRRRRPWRRAWRRPSGPTARRDRPQPVPTPEPCRPPGVSSSGQANGSAFVPPQPPPMPRHPRSLPLALPAGAPAGAAAGAAATNGAAPFGHRRGRS